MSSDVETPPLTRRKKVVVVLAAIFMLLLLALTLVAWRWRVEAMKPWTLRHPGAVEGLVFTPRGDEILTLCRNVLARQDDRFLTCWSVPDGERRVVDLKGLDVTSIDVSPSGDILAIADRLGHFHLRSLVDLSVVPGGREDAEVDSPVLDVLLRFSPSGERIAMDGDHSSLCVVNRRDNSSVSEDAVHDCEHVLGFVDEDRVAFEFCLGVEVWSVSRKCVVAKLERSTAAIAKDFASPRTTVWISCARAAVGETFTGIVRRLPGGERVGPPVVGPWSSHVAFSQDDALLAVASAESVTVQEVATGSVVFMQSLAAEKGDHVRAVAFSPTADRVAVARGKNVFVFPFRR